MSVLQEIADKGATTSWCPLKLDQPYIALGSKDGATGQTFEDYGGELAVYALDLKTDGAQPKQIGKCDTGTRFNCLAWGKKGPSDMGIIAGGMQNGVVNLWDPKNLGTPLAKVEKHKSKVNSLQFNPHPGTEHLLATGASDNEVYLVDITKPNQPSVHSPAGPGCQKHTAEVRSVSWNTEVVHVLASASVDGACTVWSLKAKKPWAEIRDPSGVGYSAIAWSPAQGLHLLTASNDDRDPVIRLWDVRSSTTNPLAEYRGHTAGIFSLSWCPSDPSFVISCAKDNKTLFWDLYTGKPVYELSSGSPHHHQNNEGFGSMNGYSGNNSSSFRMGDGGSGAASAFGSAPGAGNVFGQASGLGAGSSGRRYQVEFSPHERTIFSTCSFDRKVQFFSIHGGGGGNTSAHKATSSPQPYTLRAPGWLKRKSTGTFGFGGHFVSLGSPKPEDLNKPGAGPAQGSVRLFKVVDDEDLVNRCVEFEQQLSQAVEADLQAQQMITDPNQSEGSTWANLINLCLEKANSASTNAERESWGFMKILFEPNARDKILQQLGFDMAAINSLVASLDKRVAELEPVADHETSTGVDDPNHIMNSGMTDPNAFQQPPQQTHNEMQFQQQQQQQQHMFGGGDATQIFGNSGGSALNAFDDFDADQVQNGHTDESTPAEEVPAEEPVEEPVPTPPQSPVPEPPVPKEDPVAAVTRSLNDVSLDDVEVKDTKVDSLVSKALLIGNFSVAVDICLEHNRFADALLLSSCGGGDLWNETLEKYLNRFYAKKPYVPVLAAVIQTDFEGYVQRADLAGEKWKEVLAIVTQYARSDLVPALCEVLAARLESERSDEESIIAACFCYICAKNVDKTVGIFVRQGIRDAVSKGANGGVSLSRSIVERTSVYQHALADGSSMMSAPNVMEHYIHYAEALSSQGLLEYAARFLSSVDTNLIPANVQTEYDAMGNMVEVSSLSPAESKHNHQAERALELADRIYGAHTSPEYGLSQFFPVRPVAFEVKNIGVAPSNVPYNPHAQQPHSPTMQGYTSSDRGVSQDGMNFGGSNNYGGFQQPQQQQQPQQHAAPQQSHYQTHTTPAYNPPNQPQQQQQQQYGMPASRPSHVPQQQPSMGGVQQQYQQPHSTPGYQQHPGGFNQPMHTPQQPGMNAQYSAPTPVPPTPTPMMPRQAASSVSSSGSSSIVKENDGFGSTAGNAAAGQKYGNLTPGAGFGGQSGDWNFNGVPQQQQQQQQQAPAVPKVMPPAMGPVMQSLENHVQALSARAVSSMDKRKTAEVTKAVQILKEKLMTGGVQESLFGELTRLVQCLVSGDSDGAGAIQKDLTSRSQVWTEQKEWLKSIPSLVMMSRR